MKWRGREKTEGDEKIQGKWYDTEKKKEDAKNKKHSKCCWLLHHITCTRYLRCSGNHRMAKCDSCLRTWIWETTSCFGGWHLTGLNAKTKHSQTGGMKGNLMRKSVSILSPEGILLHALCEKRLVVRSYTYVSRWNRRGNPPSPSSSGGT